MDELRSLLSGYESGSIYVIGGESLYRDLLPLCDTAYITKVDKDVPDADAFMPDLDNDPGWAIDEVSERFESNGLEYIFVTYKRLSLIHI